MPHLSFVTVSYIATVSILIQCLLWLVGYIIYALTYSCILIPPDFHEYVKPDVLQISSLYFNFASFISGEQCATTPATNWTVACHPEDRWPSALVLFVLISVGFVCNFILCLLAFKLIFILRHKKYNLDQHYWSYTSFVTVLFLSCGWDIVLTVLVALNYGQIKVYCQQKWVVLTILEFFMIRGLVFWFSNLSYIAFFLLHLNKKSSKKNDGQRKTLANGHNVGSEEPNFRLNNDLWLSTTENSNRFSEEPVEEEPVESWHSEVEEEEEPEQPLEYARSLELVRPLESAQPLEFARPLHSPRQEQPLQTPSTVRPPPPLEHAPRFSYTPNFLAGVHLKPVHPRPADMPPAMSYKPVDETSQPPDAESGPQLARVLGLPSSVDTRPLSLQEAILTRRPLRQVRRPAMDVFSSNA